MPTLWKKAWLPALFILAGTCLAKAEPPRMPIPGSLNAAQGYVVIDGYPASAQSIRGQRLRKGQLIDTKRGKAELLLTPGSFLRIGGYSQLRMLSRSLENTAVKLDSGKALLEATANYKHDLTVFMDGARVKIDNKGLYGFNADRRTISVLNGKATVFDADSRLTLKGKREMLVTDRAPLKSRKLNVKSFKSSSLYQWNRVRDRYESSARRSLQTAIARTGRWYGPGWYWSHYWGFYAYVPSSGLYWGSYASPYYEPWGWSAWGPNWGPGWGWGWGMGDDDDGD